LRICLQNDYFDGDLDLHPMHFYVDSHMHPHSLLNACLPDGLGSHAHFSVRNGFGSE
jgi:hypothetical protein